MRQNMHEDAASSGSGSAAADTQRRRMLDLMADAPMAPLPGAGEDLPTNVRASAG